MLKHSTAPANHYNDFMPKHSTKTFQLILVIIFGQLLQLSSGFAQETDEEPASTEGEDSDDNRSVVMYVDVPLVYEEGTDPILPPFDYGEPVRAGENPDESLLQTLQTYQTAVQDIETTGGAWDPALIEELSAQGNLQQRLGDYAAAVETFDRAMHINRISSGLHTTSQIPIVEELIDSYMALEDWDSADLYHNYLFYIQTKAYGPEDPRMIPVLEGLAEWQMQAFTLGYGEALGLRLSSAQALFDAAARMVFLHFGPSDERFVPILRSIADSAYLVARNPNLMTEIDRAVYRTTQELLAARLNQPRPISPAGFRVGEAALQGVVTAYESTGDDLYAQAEALANLGDWYILFQRRRTAQEHYIRAWELLADQENAEELQTRLFGQVVPLPTFETEPRVILRRGTELMSPADLQEGMADLRFTVTRNGETRNVELLTEETPENTDQVTRVARELRQTMFRPVIEDGVITDKENNLVRIRFWY